MIKIKKNLFSGRVLVQLSNSLPSTLPILINDNDHKYDTSNKMANMAKLFDCMTKVFNKKIKLSRTIYKMSPQ